MNNNCNFPHCINKVDNEYIYCDECKDFLYKLKIDIISGSNILTCLTYKCKNYTGKSNVYCEKCLKKKNMESKIKNNLKY